MNRQRRMEIANETLDILKSGTYGNGINIGKDLSESIKNTKVYKPDFNISIDKSKIYNGDIEVTSETTLDAAERLVIQEKLSDVVCLNFASAKNPGGGFLSGSQAQEESLARASGLYSSLVSKMDVYNYNRNRRTGLYSDYIIYSPDVPVFRDDNTGKLLDTPYKVSFISSPAVNAGAVRKNEQASINKIDTVMINRIRKILNIAIENNKRTIVLGAFGCGVFDNKPSDVVNYFNKLMVEENYIQMFNKITFAIYDNTPNKLVLKEFKKLCKGVELL